MADKLLRLVGPLHIAGGLLLFLTISLPGTSSRLASLFGMPADHPSSAFFISIFGPTVASWGVLFSAVVRQYYIAPSEDLWRLMLLAVLLWAPLDTGLCLYFGLWAAALLNTIVATALVTLLFLARRTLSNAPEASTRN